MSVFWRPRGCVLWFDFAELSGDTVYDLSGNGNNGTIYNCEWRRGHLIGALYFNGENAYVEVSHLELQEHTLEVLVYLYDTEGHDYGQCFICHGDISRDYTINLIGGGQVEYRLNLDGTLHRLYGSILESKKWYFIVGTYDGSIMNLYVNMEKYSLEVSGIISPYYSTEFLGIGAEGQAGGGTAGFTHGLIAHVRIYNRALSEREIRAYANYLLQKYIAHPPFI